MSKKICICGTDHGKEKPLVITITTCKNRHNRADTNKGSKPHKARTKSDEPIKPCTAACSSASSMKGSSKKTSATKNTDSDPIDQLLYNDDEVCQIFRGHGEPVDTGIPCTICSDEMPKGKKKKEEKPKEKKHKKTSPCVGCPPCQQPPSACDLCCKSKSVEKRPPSSCDLCCKPKPVEKAPKKHSSCVCTCPPAPGRESEGCTCHLMGKKKEKKKHDDKAKKEKKEKAKHDKHEKHEKEKHEKDERKKEKKRRRNSACDECCQPKTEDKSLNCPSEPAVKLPVLIPRYHGHGCAMEVDVLEKHDKNCRLKKLKNSDRKSDDRAGSYEVIGRIIFKTCQTPAHAKERPKPPCDICAQNVRLATIYSLFNIPCDYRRSSDLDQSKDEQRMRALQRYFRHQKVLESLAKSSKSFPTNLNRCESVYHSGEHLNRYTNERSRYYPQENYEIEELFFSERKSNQTIPTTEGDKHKQKLKKWFYFFLPCLFSDGESGTSLSGSDLDIAKEEEEDYSYD